MTTNITVGMLIGTTFEDKYLDFDLTEIQKVLSNLKSENLIDAAHAEFFQQRALYGADLISEYLGKLTKLVSHFESKINSTKNKASLDYVSPMGKATAEMRKAAGESSPELESLQMELARIKGAKALLDKKYDILIKFHHSCKEVWQGMNRGMQRVPIVDNPQNPSKEWE